MLSVYTNFAYHILTPYLLINPNAKAVNMGFMQLQCQQFILVFVFYILSPYLSINPTTKAGINVVFMQFKHHPKGELLLYNQSYARLS